MASPENRDLCATATDRGTFNTLTFNRCARGFTLSATGDYRLGDRQGPHFAFDKVEDLAKWLVQQYGPPEIALVAKRPVRKTSRRR